MSTSQYPNGMYVEVLLPLALPQTYTYGVPVDMQGDVVEGIRVEVPLRNKLYSGLVFEVHDRKPTHRYRPIISVLDDQPLIQPMQRQFWQWIADYYCAHLGEVMSVAVPSGLKLSSETKLLHNATIDIHELDLDDEEYLVVEALSIQHELTIEQIRDILNKKTVYPIIKQLLHKRAILVKEELATKFKAKKAKYIKLEAEYHGRVEAALELVTRSEKQTRAVLSFYSLSKGGDDVSAKSIRDMADVDTAVLNAVGKKGIWSIYERAVSRLDQSDAEIKPLQPLSDAQTVALAEIKTGFADDKVALLHGVTGSGKTRIYIDLIKEVLDAGGQVLYLLPEIALTSQIVSRLRAQITDDLYLYHSQVNDAKRVEVWNAALLKQGLYVGARSSLFLPFSDLRLIIVDEEHDGSYKQDNPSPRYHGRDAAVYLSRLYGADIILGSATPSLESYANADKGKYALISLMERYGDAQLPFIEIINMNDSYKKGLVQEGFSERLIELIKETKDRGEQTILFQNRRGYAPVLQCKVCEWSSECPNCDVTLTYHQKVNELKCHCCGHRNKKPTTCPRCGHHDLRLLGTGTEKVEELLPELIKDYRIERFDYDTTRSKKNQADILHRFQNNELDALVGTQMLTKGFDFDNIGLVGVLNADSLLSYPDFRATERTFQLLMQVGGRAGRRDTQGRFAIQAFHTNHPVLMEVLNTEYDHFYKRELTERDRFVYPPYYHMLTVWIRHRDHTVAQDAAMFLYKLLRPKLGNRMTAPIDPPTLRIRGKYQQIINVKYEKAPKIVKSVKSLLMDGIRQIKTHKAHKRVLISVDVDPS